MKVIEEIAFTVNGQKCTYKLYKFKEQTIRKVKVPVEVGEVTLQKNYKYKDIKVEITKYALHQEYEINGEFHERLVCETEMYATILTIFKGILTEYIETINKLQAPTI